MSRHVMASLLAALAATNSVEVTDPRSRPQINIVPNRFKERIRMRTVEDLPHDERWLVQAVRIRTDMVSPQAAVSLECWLLGKMASMSVTEEERQHIKLLAEERGISLVNER